MLQRVGLKLVPSNCKCGDKSPPVLIVAYNGHGNVSILHTNSHALPKVVGEKEDQSVKDDSLNGGYKGDRVDAKPQSENEADIRYRELDRLILGRRVESHHLDAFRGRSSG